MAKYEVPARYTGNEVRRGVTLLHSITEWRSWKITQLLRICYTIIHTTY